MWQKEVVSMEWTKISRRSSILQYLGSEETASTVVPYISRKSVSLYGLHHAVSSSSRIIEHYGSLSNKVCTRRCPGHRAVYLHRSQQPAGIKYWFQQTWKRYKRFFNIFFRDGVKCLRQPAAFKLTNCHPTPTRPPSNSRHREYLITGHRGV